MKLFDPEGPLMSALGKLSDVVFANIMFCLCSLPLITIGASLSALYECTMSIVEDLEEPSMFRQFWRAFRRHLRQGTLLWLILLGGILLLLAYAWAVGRLDPGLSRSYRVVLLLLTFLFLAGAQYVFPVEACFSMPLREVLKNAWLISAAALPWTLCSLAIAAGAVYVSFFMGPSALNTAVFLWAVIGFGLVSYLQCFFLRLAFRRLRKLRGEPDPEELPDPWETEEDSQHE